MNRNTSLVYPYAVDKSQLKKIKRGIQIALILFGLVALVVLYFTVDPKLTWEALQKSRPIGLLVAGALWTAWFLTDGLRTRLLARTLGYNLPYSTALDMIAAGMFLAVVTPFQVSGLPYQLWIFKEDAKIDPGPGTALIVLRGLLIYIFVFGTAPFALWAFGIRGQSGFFKAVLIYFLIIASVFFLVFLLSLINPEALTNAIRWRRVQRFLSGFVEQMKEMRRAMGMFFGAKRPVALIETIALSVLCLALFWSTVPAVLWALGLRFDPLKAFLLQALLQGALLYSPTPGAAGIAEGAGAAVFSSLCPKHLLGVFIVLWRFFTVYMTAIVGGFFFFRRAGRMG